MRKRVASMLGICYLPSLSLMSVNFCYDDHLRSQNLGLFKLNFYFFGRQIGSLVDESMVVAKFTEVGLK